MKRNLITALLLIGLSAFVKAQWTVHENIWLPDADTAGPKIIFITDDDKDDTNVNFLKRQGFNVTKMWFPTGLDSAGQDTITMLNAADLVIAGRSGSSMRFRDSADKAAWNGLTVPLMLICPWKARNSRLNWFDSYYPFSLFVPTKTNDGYVLDPDDPVFRNVTLAADSSLVWTHEPDDYIRVRQPSNGTWLVNRGDTIPLLVRFEPGIPFYPGAVDSAAGPRTYFGMGNDAFGPANFFPLTREAKKVYLAEICRMTGIPTPEIIYGAPDFSITVVTDDDFDKPCITFLQKQGFRVKTFWAPNGLGAAGKDTINMLNAEDLIIIGRSGPSPSFQQPADKAAWNGLTSPQILNCPLKARNTRLNWFCCISFGTIVLLEGITTATAVDPDDPVFAFAPGIEAAGYIPEWSFNPDIFYKTSPTSTNGIQVVNRGDTIPLVVRFTKNVPFYPGAADSAAGERVYFGMGTDAAGPANFFPLTKTGQAIYFAEALRLLGAPAYEPVYLGEDRTLATLTVSAVTLVPAFHKDSLSYTVQLPEGTSPADSVQITASATEATSVVTGTGWVKVPNLANSRTVKCTAENARSLNYVVKLNRVTGIEEQAATTSVCDIYPNPVNDKLVISATEAINSVTIYNLQGAAMLSRVVTGKTVELSMSDLKTGIYFVKVQSGNNVYVNKVTKN